MSVGRNWKRPAKAALILILSVLTLLQLSSPAAATTADPVWKITISRKCNLPCDFPGGESSRYTLYADGTGKGEVTFLGFPVASHHVWDITGWTVGPGFAGSQTFIFTGGTRYIPDVKLTVPIIPLPYDLGVPAVEGHYSPLSPLPGAFTFEAQVTAVP